MQIQIDAAGQTIDVPHVGNIYVLEVPLDLPESDRKRYKAALADACAKAHPSGDHVGIIVPPGWRLTSSAEAERTVEHWRLEVVAARRAAEQDRHHVTTLSKEYAAALDEVKLWRALAKARGALLAAVMFDTGNGDALRERIHDAQNALDALRKAGLEPEKVEPR